ncbi:copper-transporting ATPase PAA1, chloroplastic [Ipomoea triloba]|uniref:copper-transporting ATPase PAA1, chloroplastic n=1 Tax=Ipomoea triloba TaxID=35885 RepID=UPI00125E9AEB|nr:copper-transporting ATPase PAA1, chloroplastic [Ipomoea triloba]
MRTYHAHIARLFFSELITRSTMESTLLAAPATMSLVALSKSVNSNSVLSVCHFRRRFATNRASQIVLLSRIARAQLRSGGDPSRFGSVSLRNSLKSGDLQPVRREVRSVSGSAASFAAGGGGNDGLSGNGGGGGGGGAAEGGKENPSVIAAAGEDASVVSSDVIILDVGGMTCGGCAASVKRILESQPRVSSASVNLTTETAVVWPVSEAKVVPNWQQKLGEELAKHLTSCGFKANVRDSRRENLFETFEKKMNAKRAQLQASGRGLAVSWALCAVCLVGHLSHFFGAKASWIHLLHSTGFHMSMCLFTLLVPGRQLIIDGLKSLLKGAPNMNTLVGLGALSSFAVSSMAAFIPKLGWKAFFEEPVMLIAFVLLGRNLEQRAKIKATSDMTGLLNILPSKARLVVNSDMGEQTSTVEVPCSNLSVGDQIIVLPGDRIPADGIVRAGRSTVDESSFTGEPLPVTKLPGAQVAAGSINLNGMLTVEVQRPGGETAIGDIVRLVEEAQSREAPVQRLADKVSGHFTYGVMALSAATFMFWNLFGTRVLPATLHQGSLASLALQLSCSVLVVACPCALGLATPTAVMVGTSLGATRGLLLRGGSVLESFSMVNTIVFDKTGTLTIGRPTVTEVVPQGHNDETNAKRDSTSTGEWSEVDVLTLAAGVESNTNHPIGKAIVEAAKSRNCRNIKAEDGTFIEEPGSGAMAVIEEKKVSVGTLDWVRRHGVGETVSVQEFDDFKNQSVVYVGVDGVLAGLIYVEDQLREDARHVVESLSKQGITTYLLSGDKKNAAEYVASVVGIPRENVFYGVKPDEKSKFVSGLQKDQKVVAMVGDGINDAAALASSHVGVAIGGGVGAASDVSSVVLMQNRLSQLLDALELSRLTMKTVKQNLWWAFGYNIVGLPVAAGILLPFTGTMLTPSIAGALMGLSSIGVMTNSLLLRLKFASKQKEIQGPSVTIQIPSHSDDSDNNHKQTLRQPYTESR